ncbi:MAG: GNAT family N-acetyltransferase [Acidobacteriota bacterium]
MNDTKIAIRQATAEDLPALLMLYRQLDSVNSALTPERLSVVFAALSSYPDYHIYLAEDDGTIAGTFALLIMDTLGDRCAPAGIVEDVVVDRSRRGRGVGESMMQFAMDRCRFRGCYKLVLSSNVRREDAHRFYERIGFERHGYSFLVKL